MSDRRAAIIRLLETRDANLPEPVRRSEASPGFVHRAPARTTCPDCLANGKTMFGCETCGGRGYTEHVRDRDPYATERVLPYGFDVSHHEARRERDRQIDMLGRQLDRPVSSADEIAAANAHPYAWEIARRRMYRVFDYGALDRELEMLRARDEVAYRALHAVFVYAWMPREAASAPSIERGLVFLEERLPDPLRAPAPDPGLRVRGPLRPEAGVDAKALRDAEIRDRAAGGASLAELAVEFRVSARTVYRVLQEAAA